MASIKLKVHINEAELLQAIDEKMDELVDEVFANSQSNIVDQGIVDEGTLLKTGNINRQFLSKQIVYPAPHASDIEFGRLPGSMPPVQPLEEWVRRKQIANDPKDVRRIAFAIAKDIEKNGQTPRPFMSPAIDKARLTLKNG
jgi:hypothetical protein